MSIIGRIDGVSVAEHGYTVELAWDTLACYSNGEQIPNYCTVSYRNKIMVHVFQFEQSRSAENTTSYTDLLIVSRSIGKPRQKQISPSYFARVV